MENRAADACRVRPGKEKVNLYAEADFALALPDMAPAYLDLPVVDMTMPRS